MESDTTLLTSAAGYVDAPAATSMTELLDRGVAPAVMPQTQPAPAQSVTNAQGIAWLPDADEQTATFVKGKGWNSPKDVLHAYQQAEKMLSMPADKLIRVPDDSTTSAEVDALYAKLGRPASAKDYQLKVPDGANTEGWGDIYFKANLNTQQAQLLTDAVFELTAKEEAKLAEEAKAARTEQALKLQKEWGSSYVQKESAVVQFIQTSGLTKQQIEAMETAVGFDTTMKIFANFGERNMEHGFIGPQKGGNSGVPRESAATRLANLKSNPDFRARYAAKNPDAISQLEKVSAEVEKEKQGVL